MARNPNDQNPPTVRTRLNRNANRADHEPATIRAIIDAAPICHLFAGTGVMPQYHVRDGGTLYLHGHSANARLNALREGAEASLAFTLVDGIVLARSAFAHSFNYRSVMLWARGREVTERDELMHALERLTDRFVPGRWAACRPPSESELKTTLVIALPIDEASAKVRTGPPSVSPKDEGHTPWSGVVPIGTVLGKPVPAEGAEGPPPEVDWPDVN